MSDPQTQDSRTRLMEAALLLFSARGFDGVGIRELAAKAGVNSALVQYHFGGKEGLYIESLRWVNSLILAGRPPFPTLPSPEDPQLQAKAIEALRGYLQILLEQFLTCHGCGWKLPISVEVAQAGHSLWNREMENPREAVREFLLGVIRPYREWLDTCVGLLRPDLDADAAWLAGLSIHGQVFFFHKHMNFLGLMRGRDFGPSDLQSLQNHFLHFCLRGLGIPEPQA